MITKNTDKQAVIKQLATIQNQAERCRIVKTEARQEIVQLEAALSQALIDGIDCSLIENKLTSLPNRISAMDQRLASYEQERIALAGQLSAFDTAEAYNALLDHRTETKGILEKLAVETADFVAQRAKFLASIEETYQHVLAYSQAVNSFIRDEPHNNRRELKEIPSLINELRGQLVDNSLYRLDQDYNKQLGHLLTMLDLASSKGMKVMEYKPY